MQEEEEEENALDALEEDAFDLDAQASDEKRPKNSRHNRSETSHKSKKSGPTLIPIRNPFDEYDYAARRQELIANSGGRTPYCGLCQFVSSDEAQQSALSRMVQTYVDNFGQIDEKKNGDLLVAYWNEHFKPIVIAREKKQLRKERDDAKLDKENAGEPWTEADEQKFAWNKAREQELEYETAEAVWHFRRYPPSELIYKRLVKMMNDIMESVANHGLYAIDAETGRVVVTKDELLKLVVAIRNCQNSLKNLDSIHKSRARSS